MKKILLHLLLTIFSLALTLPGFSQSMSNTDNVVTLTNTCLNAGVHDGTYDLWLSYFNLDTYTTDTMTISGVTVAISGGVMTITRPSGSFPSVATNGYWSLPDGYPGIIKLTSGTVSNTLLWYQNPDGTIGFNCSALPIDYNTFYGTLSGSHVVLHWQTAQEQNSTYIEVYRQSSAGTSYKIGQVTAAGNSSIPVDYSFTDANPCPTNTYYLKMLNSQGTPPITSGPASVSCAGCTCTLPSPVFCNFTINGPDQICSVETRGLYNLSSAVPDYSTIAWSIDQPSEAALFTYPDFDRTRVSLLKKNTTGGVTLTATLSGCTNTISKFIALGTPDPYINAYTDCPFLHADALNAPGATNFEWHWVDVNTGAAHVVNTPSSSWSVNIINAHTFNIWFLYTNGCGTSNVAEADGISCPFTTDPGPQAMSLVSPNPTTGIARISPAKMLSGTGDKLAGSAVTSKVYQVRVMDVRGVVFKTYNYPGGAENLSLDLSSLNNGIYIIQLFDNKTWRSTKVILAK